jgi:hypothetical protein
VSEVAAGESFSDPRTRISEIRQRQQTAMPEDQLPFVSLMTRLTASSSMERIAALTAKLSQSAPRNFRVLPKPCIARESHGLKEQSAVTDYEL